MPMKPNRPTIRVIAKACGLSATAVSLALRNSKEISLQVRTKVQRTAKEMGYHPDPILTHLMEHLRSNSTASVRANIALLCTSDMPFVRRLIRGATKGATRLGYSLDSIELQPYIGKRDALTRVLIARGISGILLAPAADPTDYRELLDWTQFTSVAMTYSIYAPQLNRVLTHHFENSARTFDLLIAKGFKRIGLAMTKDMEFRANRSYSGAYCRIEQMEHQVTFPILLLEKGENSVVRSWFAKHRPDAVVLANPNQFYESILPAIDPDLARKTAFVCLDHDNRYAMSGMDQLFEIVGEHSVEALVGQLNRNDRGLPLHPRVTMVEGEWLDSHGFYPLNKNPKRRG